LRPVGYIEGTLLQKMMIFFRSSGISRDIMVTSPKTLTRDNQNQIQLHPVCISTPVMVLLIDIRDPPGRGMSWNPQET